MGAAAMHQGLLESEKINMSGAFSRAQKVNSLPTACQMKNGFNLTWFNQINQWSSVMFHLKIAIGMGPVRLHRTMAVASRWAKGP